MTKTALVKKVKANLMIQHDEDDKLIETNAVAAVAYAEAYQHKRDGFYRDLKNEMPPTTEQAVIMLASHFYESRDGSTGGLFPDRSNIGASVQPWFTINSLLRLEREVML